MTKNEFLNSLIESFINSNDIIILLGIENEPIMSIYYDENNDIFKDTIKWNFTIMCDFMKTETGKEWNSTKFNSSTNVKAYITRGIELVNKFFCTVCKSLENKTFIQTADQNQIKKYESYQNENENISSIDISENPEDEINTILKHQLNFTLDNKRIPPPKKFSDENLKTVLEIK